MHCALQGEDKMKTIKTMGAGRLLTFRGIIATLRKALVPFPKMKQSEHLDAHLQSSSTVDDRSVLPLYGVVGEDVESKVKSKTTKAWNDNVDTLLPVKV